MFLKSRSTKLHRTGTASHSTGLKIGHHKNEITRRVAATENKNENGESSRLKAAAKEGRPREGGRILNFSGRYFLCRKLLHRHFLGRRLVSGAPPPPLRPRSRHGHSHA